MAIKLPENTVIKEHAIELIKSKQSLYSSIYCLVEVEPESMKTYIKTDFKTGFIQPSKYLVIPSIFFNKKSHESLQWCLHNYNINNQTNKDWYLHLSICESLDFSQQVKDLNKLDLSCLHYLMIIWESNECKTAFLTGYDHFAYRVTLFYLSNAQRSFYK